MWQRMESKLYKKTQEGNSLVRNSSPPLPPFSWEESRKEGGGAGRWGRGVVLEGLVIGECRIFLISSSEPASSVKGGGEKTQGKRECKVGYMIQTEPISLVIFMSRSLSRTINCLSREGRINVRRKNAWGSSRESAQVKKRRVYCVPGCFPNGTRACARRQEKGKGDHKGNHLREEGGGLSRRKT